MPKWLAPACAVALLAACTSSPSKAPSAATRPPRPATRAQLKKIVLQLDDLPIGWKGEPHHDDPGDAAFSAALLKCTGARDTDPHQVAAADSQDFVLGDASASSFAASYRSASDVRSDVALLRSPRLAPCLDRLLKQAFIHELRGGGTFVSVSSKFAHRRRGDPANLVAFETSTVKLIVNGRMFVDCLSVAYIAGPLLEADVDASNVGSPLTPSIMDTLIARVATRVANG
jgi:hypothetical protein